MRKLHLSLACGDYAITSGLRDGTVSPDGIDLTVLTKDKERIFRSDRRAECDIAEFNVVRYLMARERGEPIVALPIFPHRRFRHGSIYVRTSAGINTPDDLRGRKVGIGGLQPAAAVWIRGILQDQYGVTLDSVDWRDVFGLLGSLPDDQISPVAEDDPGNRFLIDEYLLNGELDALISAYIPPAFQAGDSRVERLFPDYKSEEMEYYRRFHIFPTMHVLTVREDVIDEHPWVPASLMSAFAAAKQDAYRRLRDPRMLPLAFAQSVFEEQRQLMGADPWEYGITTNNRAALEAISRYCAEQGLIGSLPEIDHLFVNVDRESSAEVVMI